jgi:hypothetical protein
MRFDANVISGYKQVIAHGDTAQDGVNLFSIDGGTQGNMLAGDHYFSMNTNHLTGNLYKMLIGSQLEEVAYTTLLIRPSNKKENAPGHESDL